MADDELTRDERAFIDAWRRSRGTEEPKLPLVDVVELRRRLRAEVALGELAIGQTVARLGLITTRHDGPRVRLDGTLSDLRASWKLHHDDLVGKGASGPVIRHRRDAVTRYCKALGIEWAPEPSVYEIRSRKGRAAVNAEVELPENFLDLVDAVIRGVEYHPSEAVNKAYQTSLRLAFKTAPRVPSELMRLRLPDVYYGARKVIYRVSKVAGPEGGAIFVPREVFDVAESVLDASNSLSLRNYVEAWRPKLVAKAREPHDFMWAGPRGAPMSGEKWRCVVGLEAKKAWPKFYPYLAREVGIIMRAVEIIVDRGHLDIELLAQWSAHGDYANLRRYWRKGKTLIREAGSRADLRTFIRRWREI